MFSRTAVTVFTQWGAGSVIPGGFDRYVRLHSQEGSDNLFRVPSILLDVTVELHAIPTATETAETIRRVLAAREARILAVVIAIGLVSMTCCAVKPSFSACFSRS